MKIFLKTKTWLLKGSFQSYVPTTRLLTKYLSVSKGRDCNNVCRVRMVPEARGGNRNIITQAKKWSGTLPTLRRMVRSLELSPQEARWVLTRDRERD